VHLADHQENTEITAVLLFGLSGKNAHPCATECILCVTCASLIPVIVYTGYPDGELMRQAMGSSPFTLLAKPCPSKQFVETVRRICHPNQTRFLKKNVKANPAPAPPSGRNHVTSEGPVRQHQLTS
jgi:FixJ family two-component response regulator